MKKSISNKIKKLDEDYEVFTFLVWDQKFRINGKSYSTKAMIIPWIFVSIYYYIFRFILKLFK